MRIIRLCTFLDFGGIEKRLINISCHNDNNEWIFYSINKGGEAEKKIGLNGKKVVCLNLSFKIPSWVTIKKLYQVFKKEKPDVVHTSGAEANFHGIIAAKLAGVPIKIAEEVGIPSQGFIAKNIFNLVYRIADVVVGNSLPVLDFLAKQNKVLRKKLKLIPNPVLFPELGERNLNVNVFNIISVSRLEPVKNIESVIRVLSMLLPGNSNIIYTIVGEGKHRPHLENLAKELKIESNVVFAGYADNPYPFMLKADLFVLTSFSEGFSNSLVEAMYCGVPGLSTKVGAAEEIIVDSENGWLVDADNDNELLKKLSLILKSDKATLLKIGTNGKKTVESKYSLSNHIRELYKIYEN